MPPKSKKRSGELNLKYAREAKQMCADEGESREVQEYDHEIVTHHHLWMHARLLLEYGESREGYWTSLHSWERQLR